MIARAATRLRRAGARPAGGDVLLKVAGEARAAAAPGFIIPDTPPCCAGASGIVESANRTLHLAPAAAYDARPRFHGGKLPHPVVAPSRHLVLILFPALLALPGCQGKKPPTPAQPQALDYGRELPPGEKALRKIPPEQYPDF